MKMKPKMISKTNQTKTLHSSKYEIRVLDESVEVLKITLFDVLINAMEDINDPDTRGKSPERYIENLTKNKLGDFDKRIILLCLEKAEIVGILIALPNINIQEDGYNIFTLGVYKAFRSKGIGSLLVSNLKEILENNGISKVTLDVHDENKRAISLYKRLGFVFK